MKPVVHDLAHFNNCNFSQFKAGGGLGIIHKASQLRPDDKFAKRLPLIKQAGLLAGAYHFNQVGMSAKDQALLFLTVVRGAGIGPDDLVCLDWEPPAINIQSALEFMDRVEQELGRSCLLYGGSVIKEKMPQAFPAQREQLGHRRLWLSEYGPKPVMTDFDHQPLPWDKPWLWQYTGDGIGPTPHEMPGTAHGADLSSFDGTEDELKAQWSGVFVTS